MGKQNWSIFEANYTSLLKYTSEINNVDNANGDKGQPSNRLNNVWQQLNFIKKWGKWRKTAGGEANYECLS